MESNRYKTTLVGGRTLAHRLPETKRRDRRCIRCRGYPFPKKNQHTKHYA